MVINLIKLFCNLSRTENGETPEEDYPNESDSEEGKTNKTSAMPNFVPQILPDREIAKNV